VATTTAYITGAGVNKGVLQVVGTTTDDHVVVGKHCSKFLVIGNFLPDSWHTRSFDTAGISRIEIVLGDGNDCAVIACNISTPTLIDAGNGNDLLKGGRGDDILLGGDGNDLLVGGLGRDLLIGGLGIDRIVGNFGDDIIIGGITAFDANYLALLNIMKEWTSDRSYTERIDNLRGIGTGDRLNGDYFLIAQNSDELDPNATVFDDDMVDILTGCAGFDWFFANYYNDDEGKCDWITDLKAIEFAEDLDFILEDVLVEEIPA
jgi:Ca2+-binding RTX toxin-like protein